MSAFRASMKCAAILLPLCLLGSESVQAGKTAWKLRLDSSQAMETEYLVPIIDGIFMRFGFEFFLGAGSVDPLSVVQPPPDSLGLEFGNFVANYQLRLRSYIGPVGIVAFLERSAPITPSPVVFGGDLSSRSARSSQLLLSLGLDFWGGRIRFEPHYGYGWLSEDALLEQISEPDLYRASYRHSGPVWGLENIIPLGTSFLQVRSIYTFGDYEVYDKRLKLELQVSSRAVPKGASTEAYEKVGDFFVSLGFHRVWKGDGRREWNLYLGFGFLVGGLPTTE